MVEMSEIEALQRRINAALARTAAGLEQLAAPQGGDSAALEAALEEERATNAQLEDRLRVITERNAGELAQMQQAHQDMVAKVGALDLELQRLRQANTALREANVALREANAEGVGAPHLINSAMLAELEGLRAARAADVAEASAILSALAPVLSGTGEGQNA